MTSSQARNESRERPRCKASSQVWSRAVSFVLAIILFDAGRRSCVLRDQLVTSDQLEQAEADSKVVLRGGGLAIVANFQADSRRLADVEIEPAAEVHGVAGPEHSRVPPGDKGG